MTILQNWYFATDLICSLIFVFLCEKCHWILLLHCYTMKLFNSTTERYLESVYLQQYSKYSNQKLKAFNSFFLKIMKLSLIPFLHWAIQLWNVFVFHGSPDLVMSYDSVDSNTKRNEHNNNNDVFKTIIMVYESADINNSILVGLFLCEMVHFHGHIMYSVLVELLVINFTC